MNFINNYLFFLIWLLKFQTENNDAIAKGGIVHYGILFLNKRTNNTSEKYNFIKMALIQNNRNRSFFLLFIPTVCDLIE